MSLLYDSRNLKYRTPFGAVQEGDAVTFTFPVSREIRTMRVIFCIRKDGMTVETKIPLIFYRVNGEYNVFRLEYAPERYGVYFYRFEVQTEDSVLHVGNDGCGKAIIGEWLPEWQLTVYQSSYIQPNSLVGGVIYHVFADRFCAAGEKVAPPYGVLKDWDQDVTIQDEDGVYRANDFFGGNLKGIQSRIPYLKKMGVTAVYLSPIFRAASNHRYDTGNYMEIDPVLGTEQDFEDLADALHKAGMKLILDGVFNHTGSDSLYFNEFGHYPTLGAYQSKESPYFNWFDFFNFPDEYHCWWGCKNVPTVRRDATAFHDLIAGENGVIEKWTKLGADAWRLDVADELSTAFLEKICKKCHRLGATVIGEVWEDASTKVSYGEKRSYLFGEQLDGVMNYPFREAILDFVRTGDAKDCANRWMAIAENYPKRALDLSMTLVGTHDTVRVLNSLADVSYPKSKEDRKNARIQGEDYQKAVERVKLAAYLQFILPGLPTVYYGDECGMQGYEDPINRRPYHFENPELYAFYCKLGEMRRRYQKDFTSTFHAEGEGSVLMVQRGNLTFTVDAFNFIPTFSFEK